MKQLIAIIITALIAWLASTFAWWMIAVVPFLVAVIQKQKKRKAFVNGLLSISLLWLYLILKTDIANDHILSIRMAGVISLPYTVFLIVNIILGGLIGGLGGWSGAAMRKIYKDG